MSRLDELIAELCPDGVEYKNLEDCCMVLDRKRKPITKAAREAGDYPYYGANGIQDYVADYIFDGTFILVGEDGSVITPTGRPVVNWAEGKIRVNNHAHIVAEKEGVLLRFLYHFIQTVDVTAYIHGNIPKFTGGDFKAVQVPVPPLGVQREIVRILDSFTLLTARKQQYEYYREMLLTDTTDAPLKRLGDTCNMKSGKAIKAVMLSSEKDEEHGYPCFGGNGIRGYIAEPSHHGEYPIIGRQGALCGNVNYATGDFYATEHAVVVKSKGEYDQRYLFYLLTSMNLNQYKSQGAQPGLAVGNIENLMAPVPSLEKQNE